MLERFAGLSGDEVWLSAIVAAELRFGAARLGAARFAATIEAWLAGFDVRPWPVEAARCYADVRATLERQGLPIGNMDLLIAAHALAENSVVVTNNAGEFRRVPRLAVEEWE